MSSIEELYQEIILEHNKRPRHYGPLEEATHEAAGHNPLCGDDVRVLLKLSGNQLEDIAFTGQGCAISKASASMMTEAVLGKSVEDVRTLCSKVISAMKGCGEELVLEEDGELASLLGVRKFPARIKCATLAWHALEAALDGRASISTELTD